MFTRRPGARNNRGRIGTARGVASPAPPASDPVTILGPKVVEWWRSDLGVTLDGGGTLATWTGQVGGVLLSQGTVASQFSYNASDAAFNGRPSFQSDGADDFMTSTLARLAPSIVNTVTWAIALQDSWTASEFLFADATAGRWQIRQATATPQIQMFNGSVGPLNNGMPLGVAKRIQATAFGTALDELLVGSVTVVGAQGNNSGNGLRVAASSVPSGWFHGRYAEILVTNAALTAGEVAAMSAYAAGLYGAGVIT